MGGVRRVKQRVQRVQEREEGVFLFLLFMPKQKGEEFYTTRNTFILPMAFLIALVYIHTYNSSNRFFLSKGLRKKIKMSFLSSSSSSSSSSFPDRSSQVKLRMLPPPMEKRFQIHERVPIKTTANERSVWNEEDQWSMILGSTLGQTFFSAANLQWIQNGIRAQVFRQSNEQFVIGNQDEPTLRTIMQSIYLTHSPLHFDPLSIPQEIGKLNQRVIDACVPSIVSEASARIHYLKDIRTIPAPMARPARVHDKKKALELQPFF